MDDGGVTTIIILCIVAAIGSGLTYIGIARLFKRFTKRRVTSDKEKHSRRSGSRNSVISRLKRGSRANVAQVRSLIEAAELGRTDTVRRLIAQGVNVDAKRHSGGRTALMKASANNHFEAVKLLLDHGASVNSKGGKSAKTALMRAAENNCVDAMRLLLTSQANPDLRNALTGRTALMMAAENGHLGAVEILLHFGADANAKDHKGRTPLMLAVMKNHRNGQEIALRLIRSGSLVNEEDYQGKRPVDMAFEAGLDHYVRLLDAHGASFGKYARRSNGFFQQAALERAYASLKCQGTDSDEHLKTQYHALVKKYHPDTIHTMELPDEFLEVAEKKFQEIHESYKMIMKSRENAGGQETEPQ